MPKIWSIDKIKAWRSTLPAAIRAKLPPVVMIFVQRHLSRFTPGFWAMGSVIFVLSFITMLLLAKIFLIGGHLSGRAIQTGQRVLIHIESGEIEGNGRHTKAEEPAPAIAKASTAEGGTIVSKDGLAPAPLASISAQTDKGLVPMVGQDGTLPWKYYARPFKDADKKPIVAIVITDIGLSKPQTEEVLKLPHNFTLSLSPYASDAHKWATEAREEGFETLVDLPMESEDFKRTGADPGPYGLLEDSPANENSSKLRWVLSRFPGFVGVLAPQDEILTPNLSVIRPTLTELAGHGILFFYIKTPKNAALADVLKSRQFYGIGIDKAIDDDIERGPIDAQLDSLTALAKTQGYAIGFAHSYPPTLEALTRWAGALQEQGVELAPVSAIALRAYP